MKRFSLIFTIFLFSQTIIFSQPSLGVFVGYGASSFDDNFIGSSSTSAGYLPVGVQVGYNLTGLAFGSLSFLAEFDYSAVPFTFETFGDLNGTNTKTSEIKISQTFVGALVKLKFGVGFFNPFIRVGGGAYLGSLKQEFTDDARSFIQQQGQTLEDGDFSFKSAFGFNVGAGTDIRIGKVTGLFGEFVYHIVSRELDIQGAESNSANNWAAHVGIQIAI
ncbi:hypothetical protein BMS3Abin04_00708 [bacterium BMS3Abin04]|nr:hypothetical protein BMS3Abin04_00708 [bacterium BMS3Abin04]